MRAAPSSLIAAISACRLCAADFAATATAHEPRPIAWFGPRARVLIAGQAPGAKVHASGKPFTDPSGDRLRAWLGLSEPEFYDRDRIAIVPMAFCFPGYDTKGADVPPPKRCAAAWRAKVLASLADLRLVLLIGGHAQRWHLGAGAVRGGVSATVTRWRDHAPATFCLPHPSWRNTGWLKRNPWFEAELLPEARTTLRGVLTDG